MKHENENPANPHTGLKRREFMAMLAGCTVGPMVPISHGEGKISQNAAIALKTWNWNQAERQKRIDAVAPFAGPDIEFYKS